jgi:hypothetical protein
MELIKALVYIVILLLILIYTLSYGIYEFKNKNMLSFWGVVLICVCLVAIPVLLAIFN